MSKTKRIVSIEVQNLKAIVHQSLSIPNGSSIMVVAGNRKGKTTLLRGLIDRIRGHKPEIVVHNDEGKGFAELTLNTGERIRWDFSDDGKEKLTFVTSEGIKTGLTRAIAERYFPESFSIDKFIKSGPLERVKQLQVMCGIDLTEINARHKVAYDDRTLKNRYMQEAKARVVPLTEDQQLLIHAEVKPVTDLQAELGKVGIHNAEYEKASNGVQALKLQIVDYGEKVKALEKKQIDEKGKLDGELLEIDDEIKKLKQKKIDKQKAYDLMVEESKAGIDTINKSFELASDRLKKGEEWLKLPDNKPKSIEEITLKINTIELKNTEIAEAKEAYKQQLSYNNALKEWEEANDTVKAIESERVAILQQANLPEGIEIDGDNIIVNGLPLNELQQSTSELYIVALKLAAMNLGEVGSLHFDAATLDRKNIEDVIAWADSEGLQLLIERPDFDGGDIEYQLLSNVHQTAKS